ncbi:MAG: hypothetical protein HY579_04685 [Nitrospinae bacterium]|nr:hypothetical protein [Nitrospinota bacterium]
MKSKTAVFKVVKGRGADADPRGPLVESLRKLKEQFGASSLKLSTEDAGMSFEQIRFWKETGEGVLPTIVKIGGPNARNDIKQLLALKVEGLIAPMVESPFGLENFMEALRDFTTPIQFEALEKHINIETVTAVDNLQQVLDCPCAEALDEITIGSNDLSRSMKKPVTHPAVLTVVKRAAELIGSKDIPVSVGGGITPATIDVLLEEVRPHRFNTRVVTFDAEPGQSYRQAVREALEFEMSMLQNDSDMGFVSADEARFRIKQLKSRLNRS